MARQTVISFFFSRTRIYPILVTLQNLFRRPLNDIRLLQFCSHAPDESDRISNDPSILETKRRKKKNVSRKKTVDFFLSFAGKWKRDRDEIVKRRRKKNGGPETVTVSDGFSKRFAFARRKRVRPSFSFRPRGRNVQLRLIRISTSLSRSSRPPLSAGRRGGRAGRVYTLSPRFESSSHRVFTFYEKQSERIFTAIAFTIVSGSHCFLHVKSYRVNGQAF